MKASEARAISNDVNRDKMATQIRKVNDEISKRAKAGYTAAHIDGVLITEVKRFFEAQGYKVEHISSRSTTISW